MTLVVIFALVAAAPLWGPGIVNTRGGGDSPFLIQRTLEMADNLVHGIFPPRWMGHAAYDLGYPFFNHYAALPYTISGGLTALGINPLSAIQATQTLGFILAALTMHLWSRRIYQSHAAHIIAVVAYTFAPFHLVNVYVRGDSLSEFYAFIWYPLILWALDRVAERPSRARVAVGALAYGALILTHNVSAMIFSPFALLYGLVAVWRYADTPSPTGLRHAVVAAVRSPEGRTRLLGIISLFIAGACLTAWFSLPAVIETKYGQMGPEFTAGYFHYSNHFRGVNLIQRSLIFDYTIATEVTAGGPFAMGLIQAWLALIGAGILTASALRTTGRSTHGSFEHPATRKRAALGCGDPRRSKHGHSEHRAIAASLVLSLGLATFMMTPLSKLLWDRLPLLEITQFPWRFLSIQALFAAITAGAIGERHLWSRNPSLRRGGISAVSAGLWILLIISAALGDLDPERLVIRPQDTSWDNLRLYESFTGNIGTTIRFEYLPQDVVPRLYTSEALVDGTGSVIAESGQATQALLLERTPNRQRWQIRLNAGPESVSFPLNWWPGWQATVDGAPASCSPMPGSGRATVTVPAGNHTVTLQLRPTTLQLVSGALSLTSAIVLAITVVLAGTATRGDLRGLRWRALGRSVALVGIVVATSLIGPLALQRSPDKDATFFDFESMPFPHQGPVAFEDARLTSVGTSSEQAAPGERVAVTLSWENTPARPLTATLRLVSPAQPRHGIDYTLADTTGPVTKETRLCLDLPEDLARGWYLLQLSVESQLGKVTPRTVTGQTMGDLYVGTVTVPQGPPLPSDVPTVAEFRDLTLHAVQTEQRTTWERPTPVRLPTATDLRVKMAWSTSGTPRNWRLSLRVLDAAGRLLVQQDHQPGYGYLPTTLWHPGELVVDYAYLSLPKGLAPGDYTLQVITYLQATSEGGGQAEVPLKLDTPTLYDLRNASCEQTRKGETIICQTREVALLSTSLPTAITEGDDLSVEAEWNALLKPTEDLWASWLLRAPDGAVVGQLDQPLAAGSRTSDWPRHAWVLARVNLDLPNRLDAGIYTLELVLRGETKEPVPCGTIGSLTVEARPRLFEVPMLPNAQQASFDETIRLLGYDFSVDDREDHLALTLWWQALSTPSQDLKRFVHLYDPSTEAVLTQDDAMPRNWPYPTTWWLPGEIVSETLSLDLANVQPGTYHLGVGWYDPETLDRLTAVLPGGEAVPSNRITLRDAVILK
ncbi:MAG: hypothetical protein J7M39_06095 [Anaerolineae bacterium]|nr:hypothetical protein [Anaerolineae bacterium]